MKTITEFTGSSLQTALKTRQELTAAGKTAEELPAALGEALKLEGDKLTLLISALEVVEKKPRDLKRVVVWSLAEGETAPRGTEKKGEHHFSIEYFPPMPGQQPARDGRRHGKGRGDKGRGDRDRKGGRHGRPGRPGSKDDRERGERGPGGPNREGRGPGRDTRGQSRDARGPQSREARGQNTERVAGIVVIRVGATEGAGPEGAPKNDEAKRRRRRRRPRGPRKEGTGPQAQPAEGAKTTTGVITPRSGVITPRVTPVASVTPEPAQSSVQNSENAESGKENS